MRFENKISTLSWEEIYEYVKKYYETHGDLNVQYKFKTNDGITYDPNGKVNLGKWIANQRQRCLPESERGKLLSQIGMRFENKKSTLSWKEMYEYVQKYYEVHGNLEIPIKFKTNDGATYDLNGKINLGTWIYTQRHKCSPESERGRLLSQIGMRFKNKISTLSWKEMYKYAQKYYESYGDLDIPVAFKTNDGVTGDPNGRVNLGKWIMTQRNTCLPESDRGKLLLNIDMRFNLLNENKKIKDFCLAHGIDIELNKMVILVSSLDEFMAKIRLSKELKLNLVDENGKLNQIFYMNSEALKNRFGYNLEELISKNEIGNNKSNLR